MLCDFLSRALTHGALPILKSCSGDSYSQFSAPILPHHIFRPNPSRAVGNMQASSARARTKGAGRRKVFAAALAASAFTAGAAGAADVDSVDDCRKDATLSISGQVNRAFLYADNGTVDDLFFVDNNNSSTRLRFRAVGRIDCDLKLGAQIEVQFRSNSTRFIRFKQDGDPGPDNFTQRKMEIWLDSETWDLKWVRNGGRSSTSYKGKAQLVASFSCQRNSLVGVRA